MTTADRRGVGAAVVREVRESPISTVLAPAALIGLGLWLMASTPAWWIGAVALGAGLGTLVFGIGAVVVDAASYRGPLWWRQATGRDVNDRPSSNA